MTEQAMDASLNQQVALDKLAEKVALDRRIKSWRGRSKCREADLAEFAELASKLPEWDIYNGPRHRHNRLHGVIKIDCGDGTYMWSPDIDYGQHGGVIRMHFHNYEGKPSFSTHEMSLAQVVAKCRSLSKKMAVEDARREAEYERREAENKARLALERQYDTLDEALKVLPFRNGYGASQRVELPVEHVTEYAALLGALKEHCPAIYTRLQRKFTKETWSDALTNCGLNGAQVKDVLDAREASDDPAAMARTIGFVLTDDDTNEGCGRLTPGDIPAALRDRFLKTLQAVDMFEAGKDHIEAFLDGWNGSTSTENGGQG